MSEEKKLTTAQRKNTQRNLDAVNRDIQISERRLKALKDLKAIKLVHYGPGKDFETTMKFQEQPEFWELAKKLDELKMDEELGHLEAHIEDRKEKAEEYTEILRTRG